MIKQEIIQIINVGWRNIWKHSLIWVFSSLPFLDQITELFIPRQETNLPLSFLHLVISFVALLFMVISLISVPYLAYRYSFNESVSIKEVLAATKRYFWKILGFSFLSVLILSPCILFVGIIYINSIIQPTNSSNYVVLFFIPFSIFSAMGYFPIVSIYANSWGVRKSIIESWKIFIKHFGVLAIIGLLAALFYRLIYIIAGLSTVLFTPSFDTNGTSNFNYLDPYVSLYNNLLFTVLIVIGQVIWTPFTTSVFVSAYLKFSGSKVD